MKPLCVFCGRGVDPNQLGVYQAVSGWAQRRKVGGANKITLPIREDRYACRSCIDERRSGISVDQEGLF